MHTRTKIQHPDVKRPNIQPAPKTAPAFMGFSQRELRRMVAAMMG